MNRRSAAHHLGLLAGVVLTGIFYSIPTEPASMRGPFPKADSLVFLDDAMQHYGCWTEGDHPFPTAALVRRTPNDQYPDLVVGAEAVADALDVTFTHGTTYSEVVAYCIPNRKALP